MAESPEITNGFMGNADRRTHSRHRVRALAYVELGENNGGIVLNVGEGGFAVRAAEPITEDALSRLRFQMQHAKQPLEMCGKLAWTSDSRKEAGVRFINLRDDALLEIKTWISQEVSPVARSKESPAVRHSFRETPGGNESILDAFSDDEFAEAEIQHDGQDLAARPVVVPNVKSNVPDPKVSKTLTETPRFGATLFPKEASPSPDAQSPVDSPPTIKKPQPELPVKAGGKPPESLMDFRIQIGKGWVVAALVTLLVAISFSAGMAVRKGALLGLSSNADSEPSVSTQPRNEVPVVPPAKASSKPLQIEIVDSSNRRWVIPATAGATHSGANTAGIASSGISPDSSENVTPPSSDSSQTPEHQNPQQASPAADAKGAAPILLSLPEHSVSASGSVAISSQRSLQVPAESLQGTSQPEKNLQVGQLVNLVDPVYPPDAQQKHVEGTVKLHATISIDGSVKSLQTLSGPPSLVPAALTAVREWRYNPTLLNGQPIETQEDISLVFRLPN
jgi:TonB family protein